MSSPGAPDGTRQQAVAASPAHTNPPTPVGTGQSTFQKVWAFRKSLMTVRRSHLAV